MPLDGKDYLPGTPIYTYIYDDGTNIHIDSNKLREWCANNKEKLEIALTPIEPKIAISFLEENVVNLDHVKKVMMMKELDPLIYGKTDQTTFFDKDGNSHHGHVMLIDGHHRYFCAWVAKVKFVPAYILRMEQWQEFQISGIANLTQEQLRAAPVKGIKKI